MYIYDQSIKFSASGCPIMRSMFFEFPEDKNCLEIKDQFQAFCKIIFRTLNGNPDIY
ncbi:MAG TPA: hypothetical protein DEG06_08980 [Lachnospiraceae bacterium]|nr:hypothetical protein [Lachnospiraceae bacterium]HBI72607.1 hypothetical protein [Lachnospiraceae bacterium]HBY72358.1 hypothetical protein [Lachnospiraceae bacterium]HCA70274.1 hypothetical protein [Lachnospiraceae bacterium]HCM11802.1 hypothetical protein [Lachnospiraceae bacterium]